MSDVADQPPLVALSLATIAVGALRRRRDLARTGMRMLIAHALATAAKTVIKRSIDRTRPAQALKDGQHRAGPGSGDKDGDLSSFPSGHTAGIVSVAQAVAATKPELAVPARAGAAAIAAMLLPSGKHYPSDIAVGALLGWGADKVAGALVDAGDRKIGRFVARRADRLALAEAEAHPS
ncbi:phosphatase PAP2 family protein [Sphingomonas radiodurans]|uniref:phosphatase PAP2 family protein n=1 Tax=Sphingomonas radiodurans TaxID=2890321 RepID=UPI001E3E4BEF|nr:phosphatase PAP2 family protein [Sphingomonas radiodurans]WBH16352.1 phosphatase PAP2 family protein [Sphingomonas radiodurans]